MGNTALESNPPNAAIDITTHASDWLWAVFSLMALADLAMLGWSFIRPKGQRAFHHLAVAILMTTTLAYFAMASDLGSIPIQTEFRTQGTRAIWYTRYIQHTFTFPLTLLLVLLGTSTSLSSIFLTLFLSLFYVLASFFGAVTPSTYKWGFYTISVTALFVVLFSLLSAPTDILGTRPTSVHRRSSAVLTFLFLLYPLAWALCEGSNVIRPTGEMIFYGIIDLLAQPVFLFGHVWSVGKVEYGVWGFSSGKASDGYNVTGGEGRNSASLEKDRLRNSTGGTDASASV